MVDPRDELCKIIVDEMLAYEPILDPKKPVLYGGDLTTKETLKVSPNISFIKQYIKEKKGIALSKEKIARSWEVLRNIARAAMKESGWVLTTPQRHRRKHR